MTQSFNLAHLSDSHLGPLPPFWPWHWNLKRAFGFLNWNRKRRRFHLHAVADKLIADLGRQQLDHIAVSGDLANIGLPEEFARARDWLSRLGADERVSVVPGNHDIYCPLWRDVGTERWRAYMTSNAEGAMHLPPPRTASHAVEFPYVRLWRRIALIGVNSAVPTATGFAIGEVGDPQRQRLESVLHTLGDAGICRIVMIHHPPLPGQATPRRALRDAPAMREMLSRTGAELVIHGHNHRNMHTALDIPGARSIPVVGVASFSAAPFMEHPGSYNIYHVTETADGGFSIDMTHRAISADGSDVTTLWHRTLTPPVAGPQAHQPTGMPSDRQDG
jgi:3',5'-cyclic AMP phosphodiesterase CpdA